MIWEGVVHSPKDYKTPETVLLEGLFVSLKDNEIMSFEVEDKTRKILVKFKNFLEKIFADIECKIVSFHEKHNISQEEFILSEFAICLQNSIYYTVETSLNRLLTDKEIERIIDKLNSIYPLKLGINQFYCKACEENSNGLKPYHIDLKYL